MDTADSRMSHLNPPQQVRQILLCLSLMYRYPLVVYVDCCAGPGGIGGLREGYSRVMLVAKVVNTHSLPRPSGQSSIARQEDLPELPCTSVAIAGHRLQPGVL